MKIKNITKNTLLATECRIADTFFSRLRGLLGTKTLLTGAGLIITPCNAIHMLFMRYPIDVVFIDKDHRVVYVCEDLKPWKLSPMIKNSHSVIELPVGILQSTSTVAGDLLVFDITPLLQL